MVINALNLTSKNRSWWLMHLT